MAGEGRRFKDKGYEVPKPLIELEGVPLFKRAIDSLKNLTLPVRYSFIVRQEHIDRFHIDEVILGYFPEAFIFPVEFTTRGAVETCMRADSILQLGEPVLVLDCDLEFSCPDFERFITAEFAIPEEQRMGGGVVSFFSQNPRYSYAQTNERGNVIRTAEKEVISGHALAGAYYFSSVGLFRAAARDLLAMQNIGKSEYYLSLLYNRILKRGAIVRLFNLVSYVSNGTPEELMREL